MGNITGKEDFDETDPQRWRALRAPDDSDDDDDGGDDDDNASSGEGEHATSHDDEPESRRTHNQRAADLEMGRLSPHHAVRSAGAPSSPIGTRDEPLDEVELFVPEEKLDRSVASPSAAAGAGSALVATGDGKGPVGQQAGGGHGGHGGGDGDHDGGDDEADDHSFDPKDPFKGGNPLEDLPFAELMRRWPTLLLQYWRSGILFYSSRPDRFRAELLSGVTVACMQVPESVAFSFVAGVDPLSGLFSSVFLGVITGLVGGKPGMISGAAGAMAVVAKDIMDENGPLSDLNRGDRFQHLMLTMTVCGAIQMVFGFLRLGGLVRLIPYTAMLGFMNALAIIIFISQLSAFQTCPKYDQFTDCKEDERRDLTLEQTKTWLMIVIVFITMIVMYLYPKTPRIGKLLPGSMVALIVASIFEHGINRALLDIPTRTVKETASVRGEFPPFNFSDVAGNARWAVVLQYAFSLAAIGLVESIMTLQACNEITSTPQSVFRANQESFAQGLANFVSSLFGAMGGDAMIGQSTINIMNGARGRLSSTSAGIFLLIFIIVASPVIELLPIAGLTGVLFMVVINTFHWATFFKLTRMRFADAVVLVTVTVLSVVYDLAIGVVVGVVLTALCGSWDMGNKITITRKLVHNPQVGDMAVYRVYGTLFFAGATQFKNAFDVKGDPSVIICDFENCLISDYSGVAAIKSMYKRYREEEKKFFVKHLGDDSRAQFRREKKLSVALRLHDNLNDREIVVLAGVKSL